MTITIIPDSCQPGAIIYEYRLDGIWSNGLNDLIVDEGTEVLFSILPNRIGVTVKFPDGRVVGDDFNVGAVNPRKNGTYILISSEGCQTTVNLTVTPAIKNVSNFDTSDSLPNKTAASLISTVYPNPTIGVLNIAFKGFESQVLVATVFNSSGQLVFEKLLTMDMARLNRST